MKNLDLQLLTTRRKSESVKKTAEFGLKCPGSDLFDHWVLCHKGSRNLRSF